VVALECEQSEVDVSGLELVRVCVEHSQLPCSHSPGAAADDFELLHSQLPCSHLPSTCAQTQPPCSHPAGAVAEDFELRHSQPPYSHPAGNAAVRAGQRRSARRSDSNLSFL